MKKIFPTLYHLLIIVFLVSLMGANLFAQKDGYELYWHDEFDGTELDTSKWKHRGLGSRRGGTVTEEAISLDGNGHLLITTTITDTANYYVGMIGTGETFNTTYGYFECRAKFGKKVPWDSFWLQCPTAYAAGPPATTGAEIDIFEFTGNKHNIMGWEIPHNVWWGDNNGTLKSWGSHASVVDNVDGFVTVAVEWISSHYIFYVNGTFTFATNKGVSGIDEYIILSEEPRTWDDLLNNLEDKGLELPVLDTFIVDYVRVYKKGLSSDIEERNINKPEKFVLQQNHPNPFNPVTSITYTIPSANFISLKVYDTMGREIASLINDYKNTGTYKVSFDATGLPSGIYYYQLKSGSVYSSAKRMLLVR